MTKIYTNCSFFRVILLIFTMMPLALLAGSPGSPDPVTLPTDPDSLINQNQPLGHLECNIHTDTNCVTHMMGLEAWIDYTFTGVSIPVTVPWSTGQTAHKIFVTPPGTWSWDVTGIGCEPVHQNNFITIDGSFFLGPLEIEGPPAICPFEIVELTVNTNGYDEFVDFDWNPDGDDLSPYTIQAPGTYTLTVWDAFSCPFTDSYTIPLVPPFVPQITGPIRICPEADTAVLVVQGTYFGYAWSNGDSGNPLVVTEPGLYEVTATDQYGCTGVGTYGVQSGAVDPFSVTVTSTTLCPGQLDTLRVLGGFSSYVWSNGHNGITNIVNQAGTYTVTVTNIYGCTGTASTTVTPLVPPNVAVSNTPLCPGGMATVAVTNGPFTNYTWSTGQNTSAITITNPGNYSVTVSGGGICATSTNIVVPLAAVPTTVIANPDLLTCTVTTDTLDGSGSSSGSNFPFVWTTLGGNFLADQNTLNPVVNQPGTYILSITNQTTGCITRDTVIVPQNITPPGANAGPPATLNCTFTTLNIGPVPPPGNPNFVPNWTTIGGNIQTGGGTWSPTVNQPGTYILTVTNTLNQCTSTASVLIPQDITDPVANIAPPSLLTCTQGTVTLNNTGSSTGSQFSYQWSTTNGTLNGPVNGPTATAASIGNYVLTVTNTLNGCTSTASTIVDADINIPMVSAIPPNILTCNVTSVLIDASASSSGSTYQYNWTTTGGTIQSGGTTLTPTVTAPGVYTLSLVNTANNCSATLGVTVQQNITPPPVNAGPNNTLNCTAPTLVLDGSASASGPGYSYIWTTTDGTILSGDTTLAPTIGSPGIYTLQVTDLNNGCTATSTTQVLQDNNAPQAIIAPPAILNCITQQVQINASQSTYGNGFICVWGGPSIAQGGTTPTPTITAPGTYCITITNTANGCTDVDCTTV
ncbi:MAG: hypothetical protein JNJ57_21340, partial [Saprospiraceae bacterium]|nr:hypothetical protein [Saprospiraceae bacterium]